MLSLSHSGRCSRKAPAPGGAGIAGAGCPTRSGTHHAATLVLSGLLCLLTAACLSTGPVQRPAVLYPASADEFRQLAKQSRKPILVVFTSESCVACRTMAPTLETLAADYAGRLLVVHADLAKTGGLIAEYHLLKVPTVIVLRESRELARRQSLLPAAFMRPFIDDALRQKAQ